MYCCARGKKKREEAAAVSNIDHAAQGCLPRMNIGALHLAAFRSSEPSQSILELSYPYRPGSQEQMPVKALQYEIDQLKAVSTRLDSLADQHPIMEQEIMSISGNILRNAVLLEVLLATRMKPA
jgi:hypothetical protein